MDINVHVSSWKWSALFYQIALAIVITFFLLIVLIWLVIEIYSHRRKKQLRIKSVRDKMDGIEGKHRLSISKTINNTGNNDSKRERKIGLNANPNNTEARELLISSADTNLKMKVNFELIKKLSDIDEEEGLDAHI